MRIVPMSVVEKLYVEKHMNTQTLGRLFNIDAKQIASRLRMAGVTIRRGQGVPIKTLVGIAIRGEKHPHYGVGTRNGKVHTEETKKKISSSLMGHEVSDETRRKLSEANIGREVSDELRELFRQRYSGEGNPAWIDGRSFIPYPPEFNEILKEKIREKYERQCVFCGLSGEENGMKLPVHHVDGDKNNCEEDNLIPLCGSCHIKEHWRMIKNG